MVGPVCLDLTRTARRLTRGAPTGIDRVELRYAAYFLEHAEDVSALIATRLGYFWLDKSGVASLVMAAQEGVPVYPLDPLHHLRGKAIAPEVAGFLVEIAQARIPRWGLRSAFKRYLPSGALCFNVGHTNLTPGVFHTSAHAGARVVMIHDVIPLSHPEFVRPEIRTRFRKRFDTAMMGASYIVVPSQAVARDLQSQSPPGASPRVIVAPLAPAQEPFSRTRSPQDPPYFVALGTVEARKNHVLLLDIWENWTKLVDDAPRPDLHIVGRRGWVPDALFARIDRCAASGAIHFHENMPDSDVTALLAGASGLLFPSFAEGFGLPAVEAAVAGLPIVVSDIPVFREVLGDIPVYAEPQDQYGWAKAIQSIVVKQEQTAEQIQSPETAPRTGRWTWDAHFNTVLSALG